MGRKEKFIVKEREKLPFGHKLDEYTAQGVVDFLYELARQSTQITLIQKKYILTLQNHLRIKNVSLQYELHDLENIEYHSAFKVFIEFCYLEKQNFEFLEDYQDILEILDVEQQDIEEVKVEILNKCKLGINQLISQYEQKFRKDDEFVFEERVHPKKINYYNIDSFHRLKADEDNEEEKVWIFSNLRLNIRHKLYCQQEVEFKGCIIYINDWDSYDPPINQIYIGNC